MKSHKLGSQFYYGRKSFIIGLEYWPREDDVDLNTIQIHLGLLTITITIAWP